MANGHDVRDRRGEPGRGEGRGDAAAEGFDGPLVLIGEETERPYERPPLSKGYLLGKAERETIYVHPPAVVRRARRRPAPWRRGHRRRSRRPRR